MGQFPTSGSRWRGVETEPLTATAPLLDPTDEKGAETLRDDEAAIAWKPSTEVDRAACRSRRLAGAPPSYSTSTVKNVPPRRRCRGW
jgi:hypothetical protein